MKGSNCLKNQISTKLSSNQTDFQNSYFIFTSFESYEEYKNNYTFITHNRQIIALKDKKVLTNDISYILFDMFCSKYGISDILGFGEMFQDSCEFFDNNLDVFLQDQNLWLNEMENIFLSNFWWIIDNFEFAEKVYWENILVLANKEHSECLRNNSQII